VVTALPAAARATSSYASTEYRSAPPRKENEEQGTKNKRDEEGAADTADSDAADSSKRAKGAGEYLD